LDIIVATANSEAKTIAQYRMTPPMLLDRDYRSQIVLKGFRRSKRGGKKLSPKVGMLKKF
jgi:hypothetical protein